jgi:hypothetical protein
VLMKEHKRRRSDGCAMDWLNKTEKDMGTVQYCSLPCKDDDGSVGRMMMGLMSDVGQTANKYCWKEILKL